MPSLGRSIFEYQTYCFESSSGRKGAKLRLKVVDPEVFRKLLQSIATFIDRAHFDIDASRVRIRSIDPHDFCYVDLVLNKSFFVGDLPESRLAFGIDVSKFNRILPNLQHAGEIWMNADSGALEIEAAREWKLRFRINWLDQDPYDLPEARNITYDACVEIPSQEFSSLVNAASTVSNELIFSLLNDRFSMTAASGDYSFLAEPSKMIQSFLVEPSRIEETKRSISASVIVNYLRTLDGLIRKCDKVKIWLADGKPVKLELPCSDKGIFSFSLSPKKGQARPKGKTRRGGVSLPRLTVTKFPEFLFYVANCPNGAETRILKLSHLETSAGDYARLASMLGLAVRDRGKIVLTTSGEQFVNILRENVEQAKLFLNRLLISKINAYAILITSLKKKPMDPGELYVEVNNRLRRRKEQAIDRQDLSTMLGLATWCGVVDRKMALYYFGKPEERR